MLEPDSFTMAMDWLLERTVDTAMNGVSFCLHSFPIWILPMMSL